MSSPAVTPVASPSADIADLAGAVRLSAGGRLPTIAAVNGAAVGGDGTVRGQGAQLLQQAASLGERAGRGRRRQPQPGGVGGAPGGQLERHDLRPIALDDLARAMAFLANRGVCPTTGEQVATAQADCGQSSATSQRSVAPSAPMSPEGPGPSPPQP